MRNPKWRLITVFALIASIWFPRPSFASDTMMPPDDSDIQAIQDAVSLYQNGYDCDRKVGRPYALAAAEYLRAYQGWLNAAILDRLKHVKSVEGEQSIANDNIAELQTVIAVQNELLRAAKLLTDLSKWSDAMGDLATSLSQASRLGNASPGISPDEAQTIAQKVVLAAKAATRSSTAIKDFSTGLKAIPPLPKDSSIFELRGKEFNDRLASLGLTDVNSFADLAADATKLKEQFGALKDATSFVSANNLLGAMPFVNRVGSAIVKLQQGQMREEIRKIRELNSMLDGVWSKGVKESNRMIARETLMLDTIKLIETDSWQPACRGKCPDAPVVPPGLIFGGTPFPKSGVSYGEALRTFSPEASRKYSEAIVNQLKAVSDFRNANPPVARLTGGKSKYKLGEEVPYAVTRGEACVDPKMFALLDVQHILRAGPFTADATGDFSPDHEGTWQGSLYMGTVSYTEFSFVVEKDSNERKTTTNEQPTCPRQGGEAGAVQREACQINGGR